MQVYAFEIKIFLATGCTCEKVVVKQGYVKYMTLHVYLKQKQCLLLILTVLGMLKTDKINSA
jgi:hypothetical protein